jgi:glutamate racemase
MIDSGLGGLSVLSRLLELRADLDVFYLGDRAWAPYGRRSLDDVRRRTLAVAETVIELGASVVVVACNTASAAALASLRLVHPDVPFVGMEPAVKPAAAATRSGIIGVLATEATFQGELFSSLVSRTPPDVRILTRVCDGWAEMVERGVIDGVEARSAVRAHVEPLLALGADTLVLGCTHYPHLAPVIDDVAGPGVTIVDPSRAVARQISRVAGEPKAGPGTVRLAVTGPTDGVADLAARLIGLALSVDSVPLR